MPQFKVTIVIEYDIDASSNAAAVEMALDKYEEDIAPFIANVSAIEIEKEDVT